MQLDQLRRREFITLLGGAVAAWPIVVWAQQPAMAVVGFLHIASPDARTDHLRAFRQGLKDTGSSTRRRTKHGTITSGN
jgi:putative tryptophan/tyrosine transport system substrate-binding protein